MKSSIDDGSVETIIDKMNEDGCFQGIDYSDLSRTAFKLNINRASSGLYQIRNRNN